MSAEADVGLGTVEGTVVERISSPDISHPTRELVVIDADGSRYRVAEADVSR